MVDSPEILGGRELGANTSPEVASMMMNAALANMLRHGRLSINYGDLVGIPTGPEGSKREWLPGERETQSQGFGDLTQEMIGDLITLTDGQEWKDPKTRLLAIQTFHTTRLTIKDFEHLTYRQFTRAREGIDLHYQSLPNHKLRECLGNSYGNDDYLFFGVPKQTSTELDRPIRAYVHCGTAHRPNMATHVARSVKSKLGQYPYGKVHDSSLSDKKSIRSDGLLFIAYSAEELTEIISATAQIQNNHPDLLYEPNRMLLGMHVNNGNIRIAQEPRPGTIKLSFNQARESMVQGALDIALDSKHFYTEDSAKPEYRKIQSSYQLYLGRFMQALAQESVRSGIHPHDINFNAGQDLGVIQQAVQDGLNRNNRQRI